MMIQRANGGSRSEAGSSEFKRPCGNWGRFVCYQAFRKPTLNLSLLSGREGGPCPRLKFGNHSVSRDKFNLSHFADHVAGVE
jgi:hypothetical protein